MKQKLRNKKHIFKTKYFTQQPKNFVHPPCNDSASGKWIKQVEEIIDEWARGAAIAEKRSGCRPVVRGMQTLLQRVRVLRHRLDDLIVRLLA